ncbi:acyl-CoA thioesterase [Colwellia sp. Arc7-635]|jgi:acyl-CoA thioester hydrolase|uniref:acyl-CoA thioesterase n=1 Tax=Colwellia sp. Arc7-635 TaxID=2497879 RepID=UPI000F858A43|nr:thioesterase family protein [Colwellia sp. Arc7-635]AZQ85870.1 acyl-CoA thioesterase [Colwellia sp. Arc7-635]
MFSEVITPRFCDTDALGHINNTMLPIWFEGAREPVFKIFMPELNLAQWRLILAKIDVNFHAQIFYGKAVELRTYIGRIGGSSFDVYQELWQNDIKCASGTSVMVNFCYENQSSLKIPADVRCEMEKHLYSAE